MLDREDARPHRGRILTRTARLDPQQLRGQRMRAPINRLAYPREQLVVDGGQCAPITTVSGLKKFTRPHEYLADRPPGLAHHPYGVPVPGLHQSHHIAARCRVQSQADQFRRQ